MATYNATHSGGGTAGHPSSANKVYVLTSPVYDAVDNTDLEQGDYAEQEILTTPQKDIQMPNAEVGVNITADVMAQIRKAAAVLGHTELTLSGNDGIIHASVSDGRDATSNSYELELDLENSCKNEFKFVISIPNLKLLPGDYFVSISSKLISNWVNTTHPVEYFIALEKNSVFNV